MHGSAPASPPGALAAAISNHVVRIMAEFTGRGPTKARTFLSEECVVVLLEDTLTKGERSLVRDGENERVLDTRRVFQRTMRHELVAGVEEILGRPVVAFMSDNHIDPDMAAEVFVLGPADGGRCGPALPEAS